MMTFLRLMYNYFDQQVPNSKHLMTLSPLLNYPKIGIKYTIGEIRFGLISAFILNFFLAFHLKYKTKIFLKKSFLSTSLLYWLLLLNLFGCLPKILNFINFSKIDQKEEIENLRKKLIKNFGKRVYKISKKFTGVSIISHLLGLLVSIKVLLRIENRPIEVDKYLLTYSIIFYIRLFLSYIRHKRYFSSLKCYSNPYNLVQLNFDNVSLGESRALKELKSCSICWKRYHLGDKLEQFRCEFGHVFHLECLRNWLKRSLTCPMCREDLYSADN